MSFPAAYRPRRHDVRTGLTSSRVAGADVVEMFEMLPNAQLAVLPGTTHVGLGLRNDEVFALITPFLDAARTNY
jgi:hypothetical protein